jgi:uncharacterized protein (TIGR02328 family)
MRLWHQQLLSRLPRQQLLGQHRECAALRGRGWGRKHSVVNYVFDHDPDLLVAYHYLVMDEMRNRGYNPDATWYNPEYRGSTLGYISGWADADMVDDQYTYATHKNGIIYPEHNDAYLQECIDNLKGKGIEI